MRERMRTLGLGMLWLIAALLRGTICAAEPRPAVLLVGGIHATYAVQPLHEMGIDVDTCTPADLEKKLASRLYNVLVLPNVSSNMIQAAEGFMAKGGGVFVFQPGARFDDAATWNAQCDWLAKIGAPLRWETLEDPAAVADVMGQKLSYSTNVLAPVNGGVTGVWTLASGRVGGAQWPMPFGYDGNWTVVVKGSATMRTAATGSAEERIRPWVPRQFFERAPPLLGIRDWDQGRLALLAMGVMWTVDSPGNCPTARNILTAGLREEPSGWLRVMANTFAWLAAPSQALGWGGARTPVVVHNPPVTPWPTRAPFDWSKPSPDPNVPAMGDQPQLDGLIGARTALSGGAGTVAEYAAAARAAGLHYIVFLEDGLKLDQNKWDQLVAECAKADGDAFAAIPGLTYEDAQGDHLYAFGDNARFPLPEMVLPDGRLKTLHVSRTENVFAYVLTLMKLRTVCGFWRHKENYLDVADYKLYNSFPVHSAVDGQPVDSALDDYKMLTGIGGCQAVLAFEIMTSPAQVASRARDGWRVVGTTGQPFGDGTYVLELPAGPKGLRQKWAGALGWYPPYQYITEGPRILSWSCQNICADPRGDWWRPDVSQYRVQVHAASDAGLKEIVIHDGDRGVFRRWRPGGAKDFAHDLVLVNCQQRDLVLEVEDMQGRRALSMEIWNRNLVNNQFMCGDRCNFLGNSRLRNRAGQQIWTPVGLSQNLGISPSKGSMNLSVQPDLALTLDTPTLPIDGRPIGAPKYALQFEPRMPGELARVFSYPGVYLMGPDVSIGQGNYILGYDPAEIGAAQTPLGHPYLEPAKQGQIGFNAWTSWYRLIPLKKVSGHARMVATTWRTEGFRSGWFELNWKLRDGVSLAGEKNRGVFLVRLPGELMRGNEVLAGTEHEFTRGTYCVALTGLAFAMDGRVRAVKAPADGWDLYYVPENPELKAGDEILARVGFAGTADGTPRSEILKYADQFGIARPGAVAYAPKMNAGTVKDTYLNLTLDGQGRAVDFRLPRVAIPGFLTTIVEGLNDNWSVHLLDRARKGHNFRGLAIRDGRAYAQLAMDEADNDLFIGHPVTCDRPEVKLLVSWQEPGVWFVEAHNAGEKPVKAALASNAGWTRFDFKETVDLPAGSSKVWRVKER